MPSSSSSNSDDVRQFAVLILGLICMGAGTGFERSLLPRMAVDIFDARSALTRLNFVATFGLFKAVANVVSGPLADKFGRKVALVMGFVVGLPVMPYVIVADSWTGITAMNVLFGLSQGFLGSALFFLLIDVMGPSQRGVAVGLGECTVYMTTAVVNVWAGSLATAYGYRPVPFLVATGFAVVGLLSTIPLRDTMDKVKDEMNAAAGHAHGGGGGGGGGGGDVSSSSSFSSDITDPLTMTGPHMHPRRGSFDTDSDEEDPFWQLERRLGQAEEGDPRPPPQPHRPPRHLRSDRPDPDETTALLTAEEKTSPQRRSMERVWSGDLQDYEAQMERMLKSVKATNTGTGTPAPNGNGRKPGDDNIQKHRWNATMSGSINQGLDATELLAKHHQHKGHRRVGSSPSASEDHHSMGAPAQQLQRILHPAPAPSRSPSHSSLAGGGSVVLMGETQGARYLSVRSVHSVRSARVAPSSPPRKPMMVEASTAGPPPPQSKPDDMQPDPPLVVIGDLLSNKNYLSLCFTGTASNFKDGFAWGTFPVFFSNVHHLSDSRTNLLIALYPLCWGMAQAFTGAASDKFGRKIFLSAGMISCTVATAMFALPELIWGGSHESLGEVDAAGFVWIVADIVLGLGTALAYPVLQAAAADEVSPVNRGLGLGFYRFVRDMGYVAGALVCGKLTDSVGYQWTFAIVTAVLGVAAVLMTCVYRPRRKTVLVGGGKRLVVMKREESMSSIGFAD